MSYFLFTIKSYYTVHYYTNQPGLAAETLVLIEPDQITIEKREQLYI